MSKYALDDMLSGICPIKVTCAKLLSGMCLRPLRQRKRGFHYHAISGIVEYRNRYKDSEYASFGYLM